MKQLKFYSYLILVFFASGAFFNACKPGDDSDSTKNEYFLSSETKVNLSVADVKSNLQTLIPGVDFSSLVTSDVEVQKLIYKTTFKNKNIQASGLVCFPKTPGNYPVLSFQNGTNTLHSDAPSEDPNGEMASMLECIASLGFVVVIPDYIGFGISSNLPHPYLDAKSSTQSILDMLRAVKELGNDDKIVAKPTKNLFIFGYSQGGWATLQLQKTIEKDYSSEFNLKASSCGGGPYSIEYMTDFIVNKDVYPMPYFLAYVLNTYVTIGSVTNPLNDFIQAPYASKVPGLFDGEHSGGAINAELTTQMASLLTPDFRTSYTSAAKFAEFRSALLSNSVVAWNLSTPTKLYHGSADTYIPAGVSQKMLADFQAKGSTSKIELVTIPGADHSTAVAPVALKTMLWFVQIK